MTLLRKKLDAKLGLPGSLQSDMAILRPLHLAICTAFSELTGEPWEPGGIDVRQGDLKTLKSELAETGLCFGYGNAEGESIMLAHYNAEFAARVTNRSLEISHPPIQSDYTPSMLDILLFKPVSHILETELCGVFVQQFKEDKDSLRQVTKTLSPIDIDLPKDIGLWNELTLLMTSSAEENSKPSKDAPKKNAKKSTAKKKVAVKAQEKSNSLALKILLPQAMLQHLTEPNGVGGGDLIIDLDNPWTRHMRQSLDAAVVPVRAVVETCRMTVADCTRLEMGQVIALPGVSLQSIGLETDIGNDGITFGVAKLGIYKSHRAVKLIEDMDPDFSMS